MTELPAQRFLLEAIRVLETLGIDYMVMGGFAVRTWGIPRPTYDADIAVAADDRKLPDLLTALEGAGFDVPQEHKKGFQDTVSGFRKVKVTRFEGTSVWDVDLFLVRGAFLESAIRRRGSRTLDGRTAWVISAEDLILMKLIAHRRKDQLDVEEILRITPAVDRTYLNEWAQSLGVTERLEEFLRELK